MTLNAASATGKGSNLLKILAIGGSDPSGGAGIQADIKNLTALEIYPFTVVTAITAQSTNGVSSVYPLSADIITAQIESVAADGRVEAIKIGMVGSAAAAHAIAAGIKLFSDVPLIIDPVIYSHNGSTLTDDSGCISLRNELIPLATVVTPNMVEATALTGIEIDDALAVKEAARKIWEMGAENVVIKGGHAVDNADDILFDGQKFTEFQSARLSIASVHGSGCAFAAALAAALARGKSVSEAVAAAKEFTRAAIIGSRRIGSGRAVADSGGWLLK